MKAIVGLGNPGEQYRWTRHNVGFRVVEKLRVPPLEFKLRQIGPFWAKQTVLIAEDKEVVFAEPQMYMNNSGGCVKVVIKKYNVPAADTLIICDEVQLPAGRIRFSAAGSSGGHNGLESVIRAIGDFPRLRIGVGPRPADEKLKDFVLGQFRPEQKSVIEDAIGRAAKAAEFWLTNGTEAAMNRHNTKAT